MEINTEPLIPDSHKSIVHPDRVLSMVVFVICLFLIIANAGLYYVRISSLQKGGQTTQETNQRIEQLRQQRNGNPSEVGKFCGGIGAIKCPSGYTCKLDGNYPDAGGTCVVNP